MSTEIHEFSSNNITNSIGKNTIQPFSAIPFSGDNLSPSKSSRKVKQKIFINMINHLHFKDSQLLAHMASTLTEEIFLVKVTPEPCHGNEITCRIPAGCEVNFNSFTLNCLIVDDGKSIVWMPIDPLHVSEKVFTGRIHNNGYVFTKRQGKRFCCQMVFAKIQQGGLEAEGILENFTLSGLRIILNQEKDIDPGRFSDKEDLLVALYKDGGLIFSGSCKFIRGNKKANSIIVQPLNFNQTRFNERKNRNPRLNLVPTPKITFKHPFNNKRVTYEVIDLTTAGFSVTERISDALMLPGLVIPDVTLVCAGGLKLRCSAQVVYGLKQKKNIIRFGFCIYDMDASNYNQLFDIFSNANDVYANMTTDVDMDSLWEFFFESSFIYPKKYVTLSKYKEYFKQTYQRLYHDSQDIFTSFTYQQNGIIYGHVSMLKAYENTWMIHHLAAKPMGRKRTGLYVLNHVLNYFDGFNRMPSVGMDYMIFYFRPNNRFPDYFFGGFCRELNNPKGCSMDCFAYLNCSLYPEKKTLPDDWSIQDSAPEDIQDLRQFYSSISGGLMVDALCLDHGKIEGKSLETMYASHGLKRSYSSSVLKYKGKLKAFIIVDRSDMGINLSELLNSIKIIVVDDKDFSEDILNRAICSAAVVYKREKIPVMVYPYEYMDDNKIPYDKKYNLWALNEQFGDEYTEHLKKKAKINIFKFLFNYLKTTLLKK